MIHTLFPVKPMTFGKTSENYLNGTLRNFQTKLFKDMTFDDFVCHRVRFLIHKNLKNKGLEISEIVLPLVNVDLQNRQTC